MSELPSKVRIVEVGPRDGLQNEARPVNAAIKVEFIGKLTDAGLTSIEAGAFVNPKWVPQMADSEEVFNNLPAKPGVSYSALVPNLAGFERAKAVNAPEVAVFTAASEEFSQKNTNCSIQQSLERIKEVCGEAANAGIPVRGYISCVVGCPYEGDIEPEVVAQITQELLALGCYEVSLGDTIGVGTPASISRMLKAVVNVAPVEKLAVHLHDTYGEALANIHASLKMGISVVDSSAAGLGGCPYAPGSSGNVATEDVIHLLDKLGIEHGVDLEKLRAAGNFISTKLDRPHYAPKEARATIQS